VLNAKGKTNAYVFVSLSDDSVFIDADPSLAETLGQRLDRYIIADDVQIEDVTSQFSLFHIISSVAPAAPGRVLAVNRFGSPGFDLWVNTTEHHEMAAVLANKMPFCDDNCAETFRIEQGIPRWGRELTDEIIPVEANLEERCIDYSKGCYIGQEVISRMKMSGQRNKSLCGLISKNDLPLYSGMRLYPLEGEKKEAGWITSATRSQRLGKQIGLGYVRRSFNQVGVQLHALDPWNRDVSHGVRVEVVALPFIVNGPVIH
jgi:folate-binding protein YgfZ